MAVPQRIALTLPSGGALATVEKAKWAETEGFDDLWFADASGIDALTTAAAVAMATERCRIGTAIVPVYSRTPAVLASTAQVLHELSGGRFILGIGTSSPVMMEGWHGQKFEKPLTRLKETVQLIKQIVSGAKTDFDGVTVSSHGYRQAAIPEGIPVYMAALREKMLETAAEFSDGVIINLFPKQALPKIIEHIRIGAERAGKRLEDVEIVCRHHVIVTDDKAEARDRFRMSFAPYYATAVYNSFLEWTGFEEAAAMIREGWAEKDRNKTQGAITDELADSIGIIGTAEECYERVREYATLGITTHIISANQRDRADATYDAFRPTNFSLK